MSKTFKNKFLFSTAEKNDLFINYFKCNFHEFISITKEEVLVLRVKNNSKSMRKSEVFLFEVFYNYAYNGFE